jgi:hypothetical protein
MTRAGPRRPDAPKETRLRRCPHCLSRRITPRGHVIVDSAALRVDYRRVDCDELFVLLR